MQMKWALKIVVGLGLLLIGLLVLQPTTTADFWILRATGEWIIQHAAIPREFPFAFTAPATLWVEHKWLFDLLVYYLTEWGAWAPVLLKIILTLAIVAMVIGWLLPKEPGERRLLAILLLTLLVAGMSERFNERAHMAGDLCLVVLLVMLNRITTW